MKLNYKKSDTIIISDLHIGSRASQTEKLSQFLDALLENPPCRLIINGDAFELWSTDYKKMGKSEYECVRKAIELSENGVKLVYIPGNHDRAAMGFRKLTLGKIKILNEYILEKNGGKYVVMHGDEFDAFVRNHIIITLLIDQLYYLLVKAAAFFKRLIGYNVSIADKKNSKRYLKYVEKIKRAALAYARSRKVNGIIIGHSHYPETYRNPSGIIYANSGDWVESCSYVVVGSEVRLEYFKS